MQNCLHQTSVDGKHKLPFKFIFSAKLRQLSIGLNHRSSKLHLSSCAAFWSVWFSFHCTKNKACYTEPIMLIIQNKKLNKNSCLLYKLKQQGISHWNNLNAYFPENVLNMKLCTTQPGIFHLTCSLSIQKIVIYTVACNENIQ